MPDQPVHKNEHTGNAALDRIQSNVRDLVAYVRTLAPAFPPVYVSLLKDTTLAAAAYATLLTAQITTLQASGHLVITFSASGLQITNPATEFFQLLIDNVIVNGCYTTVPAAGYSWNAAMVVRVGVKKGPHTVLLQAKTNVNSMRINASSVTEEHADLLVQEVA